MKTVSYIGLGSNLGSSIDGSSGNPTDQINEALSHLNNIPATELIAHSGLFRSKPHGPQDQPDFINAVAAIATELDAHALLDQLQVIENRQGRIRERHWGPRTLDLDILLYGDEQIHTDRLQVPHPYMRERPFVLIPMAQLAPELILPDGTHLSALLAHTAQDELEPL